MNATPAPCYCKPTDIACRTCGCRECGNKDGRYGCTAAKCGACRDPRPMSVPTIRNLIAFARSTWRNDGAEGETVHRLCDELERRL